MVAMSVLVASPPPPADTTSGLPDFSPQSTSANAGAPSPSTPTASVETELVEIPPSIQFTEDSTRAARATVTFAEGGVVSATGADGTTFQLQVPAHTVEQDTVVTMTPLAEVSGFGETAVHAV